MKQIKVTLTKSRFGRLPRHCATIRGLGLRKINSSKILADTPCVRGMINQVSYCVRVEEVRS
jgi:large subunit ribosomal protein L30